MRAMRSMLAVTAVATVLLLAAGCDSSSSSEVRAGQAYEAVVRWLAQDSTADPEPLPVFIESRGEGAAISLDVQAQVVAQATDIADVRFIDDRGEALTEADDGQLVVRDEGVLIRLGPVVEDGDRITLQVDRWVHDEVFSTVELQLHRSGDEWTVEPDPRVTGTVVVGS
jgi:hypothetical protein